MSDKQNPENMSGFRTFSMHSGLVTLVNSQRDMLNGYFTGSPEDYNILLEQNNILRNALIDLMLDDALEHHPVVLRAEAEDEADHLERVWDLADVHSKEEFDELTRLLWTHWTSDDVKSAARAKERIDKKFMNQGTKYAFVLSADSRGLDAGGLALLERYLREKYDETLRPVFVEDEMIDEPSHLAGMIAGENKIMGEVFGASDCYVFVLHNNKRDMECITGKDYLYSFAKTLLNNPGSSSWEIAVHYVIAAGIPPVSLDEMVDVADGKC